MTIYALDHCSKRANGFNAIGYARISGDSLERGSQPLRRGVENLLIHLWLQRPDQVRSTDPPTPVAGL